LHLKSKPKIQIKPQIQKKGQSYSQEKEKNYSRWCVTSHALARGAIVADEVLNQPEKLSDVAESAGKADGGARVQRRSPQHRRSFFFYQ
jgi:hypothetical protein